MRISFIHPLWTLQQVRHEVPLQRTVWGRPRVSLLHFLLLITVLSCIFAPFRASAFKGETNSSPVGKHDSASLFPNKFSPVPPHDSEFPEELPDPEELCFLWQYSKEDFLHTPLLFNVALDVFASLQLSTFPTNGVLMGSKERQSLTEHLIRIGKFPLPFPDVSAWNRASNPLQQSSFTRSFLVSPSTVWPSLIQGAHLDPFTSFLSRPVMDRYFVQQVGPGTFRRALCRRFVELMHLPHTHSPVVVALHNSQVATFALRCVYFQTHALRTAKRKFVLLSNDGDHTCLTFFYGETLDYPDVNVSYILRHPLLAHWYGVNGNVRHFKFTALPIGFLFFHRSGTSLVEPSRRWERESEGNTHQHHMRLLFKDLDLHKVFPHIQHELRFGRVGAVWLETALEMFAGGTTDPPVEWIPLEQLPERVTTVYVVLMPLEREKREGRPSLTSEVLVFRSESGNRATAAAQHVALLPFTAALYHKLQQHPYGDPKRELKVINAFTVWDWRKPLMDHLVAHPELSYTTTENVQREFFRHLNNFTFVASPIGVGYECYRTWEALAFGAIPILQHPRRFAGNLYSLSYDKELEYGHEVDVEQFLSVYQGLPVVIINDPEDITRDNLQIWQSEIHEKFTKGEYNLEKLFMQHWVDKIYGHTNNEDSA